MQRQKNQMMLNLGTGVLGEAQNAAAQETEIGAAEACLERPAVTGPSMESVVDRNNMRRWSRSSATSERQGPTA